MDENQPNFSAAVFLSTPSPLYIFQLSSSAGKATREVPTADKEQPPGGARIIHQMATSTKPQVNIAVIGQFGDGKTTLTAAITKVLAEQGRAKAVGFDEIDKAPVERKEGVKIAMTHVEYETAKRHYRHVDCPTQIDNVKNLIAGAPQMDGVILVVSATDGAAQDTVSIISLARQVGVTSVVVFLNKVDIADDTEMLELVEMDIVDLLNRHGYPGDNTPIIRGSALSALQGEDIGEKAIQKLLDTVDEYIPYPPQVTPDPGSHKEFKAVIYFLTKDEGGRQTPIFPGGSSQFRMGSAADVTGTMGFPSGKNIIVPGEYETFHVVLTSAVTFGVGQRFEVREGGKQIGIGSVSKIIN